MRESRFVHIEDVSSSNLLSPTILTVRRNLVDAGKMAQFPTILGLRHGETEWNREGRFQGGFDSSLTPLGRRQAGDQRAILQQLDLSGYQWFCSPQPRAVATAQIVKGGSSEFYLEPSLREIAMGDWAGRSRAEIAAVNRDLDLAGLAVYWHLPGGETPGDVAKRVEAFLERLSGPAVIVTHGVTLRLLACVYFGRDLVEFGMFPADHGVVYRLDPSGFQELT